MEEKEKRNHITISNADKGRAVVIRWIPISKKPIGNYMTKHVTKDWLKNQHYNIIEWLIVNQTIERFKNENLLSQKTANGLKTNNAKTRKFYIALNTKVLHSPVITKIFSPYFGISLKLTNNVISLKLTNHQWLTI